MHDTPSDTVAKETCTDCNASIYPEIEQYKLRRNSDLHQWEPICMACFYKMVMRRGGRYGNLEVDMEKGTANVEIVKVDSDRDGDVS